ncbi:hypothetical protein SMI01S_34840 [Sphingobacterium mizutaii NBRC 14946 = DSM 11724]|uniref:Uncharacterized protein n=2 Tax=Sphingobacterium mizutaii TaxID=1010 RepID=A0AAJ4XFP7_9SPHI|nr:hypothetical protein SMI01S_34840 [Sphingobacterium mizutaii NBRC 14946 = DSM 11724]SDL65539.1 hypothetical protein SAMN05192578_10623 [Sphingobacterium mizutaii]SNV55951.1 Uncharacterised protein [Sphingobacterium mizutaii]
MDRILLKAFPNMPRMILEYSQDINLKNSCKIVPIKQYYEISKNLIPKYINKAAFV